MPLQRPVKLWANHKHLIGRTISEVRQDDDFILLFFEDGGYVSLRQNYTSLTEDFGDGPKTLLKMKTWDIVEAEGPTKPLAEKATEGHA